MPKSIKEIEDMIIQLKARRNCERLGGIPFIVAAGWCAIGAWGSSNEHNYYGEYQAKELEALKTCTQNPQAPGESLCAGGADLFRQYCNATLIDEALSLCKKNWGDPTAHALIYSILSTLFVLMGGGLYYHNSRKLEAKIEMLEKEIRVQSGIAEPIITRKSACERITSFFSRKSYQPFVDELELQHKIETP